MDWFTWEPYYLKVANELKLNIEKDYEIAEKFSLLIKRDHPSGLNDILIKIKSKKPTNAWIFGAGPSLEGDFEVFKKFYSAKSDLIIGIDGTCLFLLEQKIYPDIIFSDLDGSLDAVLECIFHGSILIIHAHGDNFDSVLNFYPNITKFNFLPTVQTKPDEPYIFNVGGFTDGDRAISGILEWFPLVKIILLGFTFGKIQGRYSKPTKLKNHVNATEFKLKKLNFAKEFITVLGNIYPNQLFNFSNPTETITGVSQNLFYNKT